MNLFNQLDALHDRVTDLERRMLLVQELLDVLAKRVPAEPKSAERLAFEAIPELARVAVERLHGPPKGLAKRPVGWPKGKPRKVVAP